MPTTFDKEELIAFRSDDGADDRQSKAVEAAVPRKGTPLGNVDSLIDWPG